MADVRGAAKCMPHRKQAALAASSHTEKRLLKRYEPVTRVIVTNFWTLLLPCNYQIVI